MRAHIDMRKSGQSSPAHKARWASTYNNYASGHKSGEATNSASREDPKEEDITRHTEVRRIVSTLNASPTSMLKFKNASGQRNSVEPFAHGPSLCAFQTQQQSVDGLDSAANYSPP